MEHHVATGCVLTEETNKRHTVDTGVEGDQSTPALRRMLLCKRGPSKEQKEKLKAELFLTEWACMFKQLGKVFTAWQMQITGGAKICITDLLFSAAGGRKRSCGRKIFSHLVLWSFQLDCFLIIFILLMTMLVLKYKRYSLHLCGI